MADFIRNKADYFKQNLTAEQSASPEWKKLLADIRHTVGDYKRWGGDLEISALSCMFQCPIQYISSRQGDVFDELVTTEPNESLGGWWKRYKRRNNFADDFFLKLLTIYEEGRHWQSSEPWVPQEGTSAAGGTVLTSPGFAEGVRGDEVPAAGAPSSVGDGTPTKGGDALATPGSEHGVWRLVAGCGSTLVCFWWRGCGGTRYGTPHERHACQSYETKGCVSNLHSGIFGPKASKCRKLYLWLRCRL